MDKKKQIIDWSWVNDKVNNIGELLERFGGKDKIKRVAGIPRGGLIPAVIISHTYGIPFISYSSAKQLSKEDRKQTLVVDDICDSGLTIQEAEKYDFTTAALVTRSGSSTVPTFSGDLANHQDWFVFPWENTNADTIQDYLVDKK